MANLVTEKERRDRKPKPVSQQARVEGPVLAGFGAFATMPAGAWIDILRALGKVERGE